MKLRLRSRGGTQIKVVLAEQRTVGAPKGEQVGHSNKEQKEPKKIEGEKGLNSTAGW